MPYYTPIRKVCQALRKLPPVPREADDGMELKVEGVAAFDDEPAHELAMPLPVRFGRGRFIAVRLSGRPHPGNPLHPRTQASHSARDAR
jgi:hypothetical protein